MKFFFSVWFITSTFFFSIANAASHNPQELLANIHHNKHEGQSIYNLFCVNCHAQKPLIPLGAPRLANEKDWKLRLQHDAKLTFQHTDEGFNAMPPRGGCFECTDDQLILAIVYMVPNKAQNSLQNALKAYKKNTK